MGKLFSFIEKHFNFSVYQSIKGKSKQTFFVTLRNNQIIFLTQTDLKHEEDIQRLNDKRKNTANKKVDETVDESEEFQNGEEHFDKSTISEEKEIEGLVNNNNFSFTEETNNFDTLKLHLDDV